MARAHETDGAGTFSGLQYLFAADGSGRVKPVDGTAFEVVDLPVRGIVAVPDSSPAWFIEDSGGLELIRITPSWPAA
jgi:hypothetical protein